MDVQSKPRVFIFLVDDHPHVRRGLALALEQAGYAVCGEADCPTEMLAHPKLATAHLVILDLSFDWADGLEFIPELSRRGILALVYSMHEELAIVKRALAAGARGYVTKREAGLLLSRAIRTVLEGEVFISPRAAAVSRYSCNGTSMTA